MISGLSKMRPLTDDETRMVLKKLDYYIGMVDFFSGFKNVPKKSENQNSGQKSTLFSPLIGDNVVKLIDRNDDTYCFRLHRERVYYASEKIMKAAATISKDCLVSFGVCIGKFTKSRKFRLHCTFVDYLAPYAKNKVWLKAGSEQAFLYGNHCLKSGITRVSEEMEANQGVVVFSSNENPIGFGVSTKSTAQTRNCDPHVIVVLHQADVGEYLRSEEHLI